MASHLLIFSDLDGTLLDAQTYTFEPVLPALHKLREQRIPLIMCSSKTRMEVEVWKEKFGLDDPFIVENGGAIVFPSSCSMVPHRPLRETPNARILELGISHEKICDALERISRRSGIRVKGLSEMSLGEIVEYTGLSQEEAAKAREREYSEPFVIVGQPSENAMGRFLELIRDERLTYTRGGRFHHLMGGTDKGKAVRLLAEIIRSQTKDIRTVGLGDSPNDIPMLQAVDVPILVQRPDGTYSDLPPGVRFYPAPGIGPHGWAAAVDRLLEGKTF